jgi:Asp-tRNA(Asn)/Glu-tRNA(Gln) amidotransferase C subunit
MQQGFFEHLCRLSGFEPTDEESQQLKLEVEQMLDSCGEFFSHSENCEMDMENFGVLEQSEVCLRDDKPVLFAARDLLIKNFPSREGNYASFKMAEDELLR